MDEVERIVVLKGKQEDLGKASVCACACMRACVFAWADERNGKRENLVSTLHY